MGKFGATKPEGYERSKYKATVPPSAKVRPEDIEYAGPPLPDEYELLNPKNKHERYKRTIIKSENMEPWQTNEGRTKRREERLKAFSAINLMNWPEESKTQG